MTTTFKERRAENFRKRMNRAIADRDKDTFLHLYAVSSGYMTKAERNDLYIKFRENLRKERR